MGIEVVEVTEHGPCYGKVVPGERLEAIDGHPIADVLDYMHFSIGENPRLTLSDAQGNQRELRIHKPGYEELGLGFPSFLMDKQKSCANRCIFCFIDQLPKGLRPSLYFKDDDARLSFLMGNYITLTNLSQKDIDRICKMRISPINISVHTTDPQLRVKMMKNPNAAKINEIMRSFADAGITMNCQIVLCKNVNDGEHLTRTLCDLRELYPAVSSVSVVPVGLSRHRKGLYPLESFTRDECAKVISDIHRISDECKRKLGVRLFYPSDEFFIKGGVPLPDEQYYDGYPQIENGDGLSTSLITEVEDAVRSLRPNDKPTECAVITGVLPAKLMQDITTKIAQKRPRLNCKIYPIVNRFFGEEITVAGLVTATDIIAQLKDNNLPQRVLIPSSMLRAQQDMFLDSITVAQVEKALDRKLIITGCDGHELVEKILDERLDRDV